MIPASTFSLVVLVFLLGAQWFMRPSVYGERGRTIFFKLVRMIFWVLVIGSILLPFYFSYQQYQLWLAHPISQLLLPPHQSISYFLQYAFSQFFFYSLLTVALAIACWLILKLFNKLRHREIFELSEGYLFGASVMLIGFNNIFWYLLGILAAGLAGSVYNSIFRRGRFSLQYFWLPLAIFTILIVNILN